MIEYKTIPGNALEMSELGPLGALGWVYCGFSPNLHHPHNSHFKYLFIFQRESDPNYPHVIFGSADNEMVFVTALELQALKDLNWLRPVSHCGVPMLCFDAERATLVKDYLKTMRS
jgi:hypothetical protein